MGVAVSTMLCSISCLARKRAEASQNTAIITRMKMRRSAVMLVRRSHADSGRSTSPTLEASSTPFSISGRTGGSSWLAVAACRLAIVLRLLFLDLIGEQHVADLQIGRAHV